MERDAEIEQVRRELAILQARYALYCRTARIMGAFSVIAAAILMVASLAVAAKIFLFDVLYGLFFIAGLLVFVLVMAWYIKSATLRWIDIACPQIRGIYNPYLYYPDVGRDARPRSDAELLEWQIAERERRLSDLTATKSGVNQPD